MKNLLKFLLLVLVLSAGVSLLYDYQLRHGRLNLSPRVGVAWDATGNGRLALRAAYGITYDFPTAETLAGLAAVVVAVALVVLRRLPNRRWRFERLIYAGFLAAMPFIYLAAALKRGSSFDIAIELVGVPFSWVSRCSVTTNRLWPLGLVSPLMASVGTSGITVPLPTSPVGTPSACLVVDLALGFLVVTQASVHQVPNKALQRTDTPPLKLGR